MRRLWPASASDHFDFQDFGRGDFAGAGAAALSHSTLMHVLYPDDSTSKE